MIVSEAHRQLVGEVNRLVERLGLSKWMETDVVPSGDLYLCLVPALHAIVDRLEKLEGGRAAIAAVEESRV